MTYLPENKKYQSRCTMYIKQVIIQGFKSFREQTVIDPFDPRHNVVVGRNGTGKSNFFEAIQFVLSDEYTRLRSDQLQSFLHEGTGPRVISAYVEIIFDNSDGRIPIEKNEVYLRRVFGAKKDQYYMNKKLATRSDVLTLLESAGFSKSNPYYIVKQGKINQMATAPDTQRLKLLREVAGTRVFDDRYRESKISLKETAGKLKKINEFLISYDERLQILEGEKKELKEFKVFDDQRRYLEYMIYDRELKEQKKKLQELEEFRVGINPIQSKLLANTKDARDAVQAAIKCLKQAKKEVNCLKEERKTLSAEQQELLKEQAKLTLTINDLLEDVSTDNNSRIKAEEELEKLKTNIANLEQDLERIRPRYEEIKSVEEKCTQELALKKQKRNEVYAKLRIIKDQFTNEAERNEWIQTELRQLEKQIKDKKNYQLKINEDLQKDAERQIFLETRIKACDYAIKNETVLIDKRNKLYDDMIKAKDQYQATRKEQYRSESVLQLNLSGLKEELAKADQSLRSIIGNSTLNGCDSVRKVIDIFSKQEDMASKVSGYHGLLIENFDCDENIFTAIEVTAGNRLFHHVVETDKFGTVILKEMNNQRFSGEAAFMTLNRLQVKVPEYPRTSDAIPMISKLKYDPKLDKVFRHIFGRALICRNLEVAGALARSGGLDCVTMDGDQVFSRGPLTGGYFNPLRSRMRTQRTRSELILQINGLEDEIKVLTDKILNNEQSIISHVTEMQKIEIKNSKAKDLIDKMNTEIRLVNTELETIKKCRISKEQSLAECASNLEAMNAAKKGFESEMLQKLTSQLSIEDQHQVDRLIEEIELLTTDNKKAFTERMQLEAKKYKYENLLANNLVRRRGELVLALQEISSEDRQRKLKSFKKQLGEIESRLVKFNSDLKVLSEEISAAVGKQKSATLELERMKLAEKESQDRIEENTKDLGKIARKENLLQQKISNYSQKIADLAALPSHETFAELMKLSTKQLLVQIENTNQQLKKYSLVNKKAADQFVSFSDEKENLYNRKKELDRGHEKITELMFALEQQKYAAIDFTFKQVSKYFTEVFGKLVPFGRAQLIMQTFDGEERDAAVDSESIQDSMDSDTFVGVGIRVSFTGQRGETREMNQLSGGQKSLVALALIFAIQKCDPAPFYLFDEIDQALDTEHRKAVADMIHELSSNAQFITTTFRPELLSNANKFYGVKFGNKVSHVECITLKEAADFVKDDTTHG